MFDLHSQQANFLETVPDETSGRTTATRLSSDFTNIHLKNKPGRLSTDNGAWTENKSRI